MVQTYTVPLTTHTVQAAIATHTANDVEALRSSFSGTSAPTSPTPVEGQLWADTTNDTLNVYDGSSWRIIAKYSANAQLRLFSLYNGDGAPSGSGATANYKHVMVATHAITITAVRLLSDTSASTSGTDYYTFRLRNRGTGGAGTTDIATATTNSSGGAAITADTPYTLTLTANVNVAAGEIVALRIENTLNPTALTSAKMSVIVEYKPQ